MTDTCWKCGASVEEKVQFRSICEHCFAYLHCCKGCSNYCVGKPNDCLIPATDPISDREKNNYCEDFKILKGSNNTKKTSVDEVSKKLFKED